MPSEVRLSCLQESFLVLELVSCLCNVLSIPDQRGLWRLPADLPERLKHLVPSTVSKAPCA